MAPSSHCTRNLKWLTFFGKPPNYHCPLSLPSSAPLLFLVSSRPCLALESQDNFLVSTVTKSVKGVVHGKKARPESLEGLGKLIYLEATEVDFVKVVVPHHGLGAKNKPRLRKRALIDVFVLPGLQGLGTKERN